MIYDSFTYYNEIDLLKVRLVEHSKFVDRFVVVEGDKTFVGKPKSAFLDLLDPRLKEFKNRITTVRVPLDANPKSPWDNELVQRNAMMQALDYKNDDVVFVSDLDEIVSRHHWPALFAESRGRAYTPLCMSSSYYCMNLLTPERFTRAKLLNYGLAKETGMTIDQLRMINSPVSIPFRGWHFSFLGDVAFIRNKLASFSHQEYNTPEFNSQDSIAKALSSGSDLFGRYGQLTWVRVTDRWPLEMLTNPFWSRYVAAAPSVKDWLAGRFGGRRRRLP